MEYASFWRRFGAFWTDFIVVLPLLGVIYFFGDRYRLFQVFWLLPSTVFGVWFSVYLVARHGGTPGKILLKTRIVMLDGSQVTAKAAVIRYSVLFALSLASSIAIAVSCLNVSDDFYFSQHGYGAKATALVNLAPPWYGTVSVLTQIWVWSEFATMLFNKKRRAVHDFIAGTVVVKV
jgi:uncharacterized RDD family membrane protein YckC